ncbi:MAG: DUF1905 domain-containing protein [Chitinophagaceae bacterium]|nr:MAG: DUF1905 domain-containing protein [Chitinophagaceae bacterium]
MIEFKASIKQFGQKADKTHWVFIEIPGELSQRLNSENRRAFQVKGKLDNYAIKSKTIFPLRGGGFIMPLNKSDRKQIGKRENAMLNVQLERDKTVYPLNTDLVECLADEPEAASFFYSLVKSHQNYFSKWIDAAKTVPTKTKRIVQTLHALSHKLDYSQMMRFNKNKD